MKQSEEKYQQLLRKMAQTKPAMPDDDMLTNKILQHIRHNKTPKTPVSLIWLRAVSGMAASVFIALFILQHSDGITTENQYPVSHVQRLIPENHPCLTKSMSKPGEILDLYTCYREHNKRNANRIKSFINQ
jgi:hypothetical protein